MIKERYMASALLPVLFIRLGGGFTSIDFIFILFSFFKFLFGK